MKKLFKSFLALFMVAVLGMGISVSAMATDYDVDDPKPKIVSTIEMENRAGTQVGYFSTPNADIYAGSVLGACRVGSGARNIKATISGVDGYIILKFLNLDTGDFRSLTTTGNSTYSLEYVTSLDSGIWQITVFKCANTAKGCNVAIEFYK